MTNYTFTIYSSVDAYSTSSGNSYTLERAKSLLNNFMLHGIHTQAKCGGKAICSQCRVKILSEQNYCNKPVAEENIFFTAEQIKQGWRLACQLYSLRDISLYLPSEDSDLLTVSEG